MDPEMMFRVMSDSTLCLSEKSIATAFNDMCHTLHTKWDVEKSVLGKMMEDFGHVYMDWCRECGTDFVWNEECPECKCS
jgi:hypothetical protein